MNETKQFSIPYFPCATIFSNAVDTEILYDDKTNLLLKCFWFSFMLFFSATFLVIFFNHIWFKNLEAYALRYAPFYRIFNYIMNKLCLYISALNVMKQHILTLL